MPYKGHKSITVDEAHYKKAIEEAIRRGVSISKITEDSLDQCLSVEVPT